MSAQSMIEATSSERISSWALRAIIRSAMSSRTSAKRRCASSYLRVTLGGWR